MRMRVPRAGGHVEVCHRMLALFGEVGALFNKGPLGWVKAKSGVVGL